MNKQIISVQVLGSGCPTCKKFFEMVQKVAAEESLEVPVEYVTDMAKIIELGVMTSPALAINGRPVLTGGHHDESAIRAALLAPINQEEQESDDCPGSCGCGCGRC
jgi:small redox-active disulfide protein 2